MPKINDIVEVWDDNLKDWYGIQFHVTKTAAGPNSKIINLTLNGTTVFGVDASGNIISTASLSNFVNDLDYTDFGGATPAQGALADTALQSGDPISWLFNDAGYGGGGGGSVESVNGLSGIVVLTPGIIGAATSAQGSLADTALQSGAPISYLNDDLGYLTKAGFTYVSNVTGGNIDITYIPGTDNNVVSGITSDASAVTITVTAEGGATYKPTITVDGSGITLTEDTNDKRMWTGSQVVALLSDRTVAITSTTGNDTSVDINQAAAGPVINTAVIGSLPGIQTTLRSSNQVAITGTQEVEATHIKLDGTDAFSSLVGQDGNGWVAITGTTFSITGVVSGNSGSQTVSLIAKNVLGTEGASQTSSNSVTLDQAAPSIGASTINYPASQSAFKGTEVGSVDTIVSDFDSITYSSPNNNFTPTATTTYTSNKTITCTNPGTYNDSSSNFRIVAAKSSNGSSTMVDRVIEVADVAPTVTITQPQTRLRSSAAGTDYLITATSNQNLDSSPLIDVAVGVGGTWQGANWAGSNKVWTRTLRIADTHTKGTGAWTFNTTPTNNANTSANIAGTQNNGGFVTRDITLNAFANEANLTVNAVDYAKCTLAWLDQDNSYSVIKDVTTRAALNTSAPVVGEWCLTQISPQPNVIRILDTDATNSRSSASTIRIQETV